MLLSRTVRQVCTDVNGLNPFLYFDLPKIIQICQGENFFNWRFVELKIIAADADNRRRRFRRDGHASGRRANPISKGRLFLIDGSQFLHYLSFISLFFVIINKRVKEFYEMAYLDKVSSEQEKFPFLEKVFSFISKRASKKTAALELSTKHGRPLGFPTSQLECLVCFLNW